MALFAIEVLSQLPASIILVEEDGKMRAWLISALLQALPLAGVAVFAPDESNDLHPLIVSSRAMPSESDHEEETQASRYPEQVQSPYCGVSPLSLRSTIWNLLSSRAPHGLTLVEEFIKSHTRAPESEAVIVASGPLKDLLQHFVSDTQKQSHGAPSLAFVLRLLMSWGCLSPAELAAAVLPALPLTFETGPGTHKSLLLFVLPFYLQLLLSAFDARLNTVEASIPVFASAAFDELKMAKEVAGAMFTSLKEAHTADEVDARRILFTTATLAAFYWPDVSLQPVEVLRCMAFAVGTALSEGTLHHIARAASWLHGYIGSSLPQGTLACDERWHHCSSTFARSAYSLSSPGLCNHVEEQHSPASGLMGLCPGAR